MDRIWVGYWVGGITMAISILIAHWMSGNPHAPLIAAIGWVLTTPAGIFVANRL